MKYFLPLIWLVVAAVELTAQLKTEAVPLPPSPTAMALMEYVNIPVHYYSGIASVTVPLFELKGNSMVMPVNLSYHTSGIKVQDIASTAGLGWNLNAGGAITRVVRGLPTESFCADYDRNNYRRMLFGLCDSQPDIFYFNFLGRTGRFVLDKTGNPVLIPYQNLDITPAIGPLASPSWIITDEAGYKYYFGESSASYEYSNTEVMEYGQYKGGDNIKRYISAWYLTRVVDPNGRTEITFQYEAGATLKYEYYAERASKVIYQAGSCPAARNLEHKANTRIDVQLPKYVKEISTHQGKVSFTYSTGRKDLPGGQYLTAVTLSNSGGQLRKYNLVYDYFRPTNSFLDPGFLPPYPDGVFAGWSEAWRLKLVRVEIDDIVYREFTYNHAYDLPPRNSVFEDHWGYFNWRDRMYPRGQSPGYWSKLPTVSYEGISVDGAKKDFHFEAAMANILIMIKYPAGGTTEFMYESSNNRGIRVAKIIDRDGGRLVQEKHMLYSSPEAYRPPQYHFTTAGSREAFGSTFGAFGNFNISIDEGCPVDYLNISSSAYNELFDLGGNAVGYGKVTVLTNGNGKEEFYYTNFNDHPDEVPLIYHDVERITDVPFPGLSTDPAGPPFPAYTSNFWERGVLFKREVLAQEESVFKVVSRELIEYDFDLPALVEVEGVTIMSLIQTLRINFHSPPSPIPVFSLGKYRMVSKAFVPKRIVREIFDQVEPGNEHKKIPHVTEYFYNPVDPPSDKFCLDLMPRKIVQTFANGEKHVTENKFPADYPSRNRVIPTADDDATGIFLLKAKQIDNALIESITYLEKTEGSKTTKTITGGSLEKFRKFQGTDVFAAERNKLKTGVGLPFESFPWSRITSHNLFIYPKQNYKSVLSFHSYDGSGSPVGVVGEEGIPMQYTWGNNGSLLLKQTKNPGAQEHSVQYIHLPLIGLSRVTDPNGRTTQYNYDYLKRLKLIRDHDNAIETRYRYHYKNQSGSLPKGQMTSSGCNVIGKRITFSAPVTAAYGTINYAWEFGDGSTAETSSGAVSHIFLTAGNYLVKVRRTNPEYDGESVSSLVMLIKPPLGAATICAHGMVEVDICGIRPPRVVQCPEGIGPPDISPDQAPISGIQAPTFKAQSSGSDYRWEYKFKNGSWTAFGGSVPQVIGPPGFGTAVGLYSIRCTIKDACGASVVSNILNLTVYASKETCPQL